MNCWRAWIRECHIVEMVARADALDMTQLKPYMCPLVITLLTRMQMSEGDKYVYHFMYFPLLTMVIDVVGMGPDYVISTVEEIQLRCMLWCRRGIGVVWD